MPGPAEWLVTTVSGRTALTAAALSGQVLGQLVGDELLPVDVVRERQDRPVAGRLDLVPRLDRPVPGLVQGLDGPVLLLQPLPEAGLGRMAVAELDVAEVADVIDLGPVDDVGLAPEVPAVEGGLVLDRLRRLGEEPEDLLPDAVVVEAEPGRRLGLDGDAVRGDELGVGILRLDPVGGGVDVDLEDDLEARLGGQVADGPEGREIVRPSSFSQAVHSIQQRTVLNPRALIWAMSFRQTSGERGVTASSIGARAVPPAYQTETGKNPLVLSPGRPERPSRRRRSGRRARRPAPRGALRLVNVMSLSSSQAAGAAGAPAHRAPKAAPMTLSRCGAPLTESSVISQMMTPAAPLSRT